MSNVCHTCKRVGKLFAKGAGDWVRSGQAYMGDWARRYQAERVRAEALAAELKKERDDERRRDSD